MGWQKIVVNSVFSWSTFIKYPLLVPAISRRVSSVSSAYSTTTEIKLAELLGWNNLIRKLWTVITVSRCGGGGFVSIVDRRCIPFVHAKQQNIVKLMEKFLSFVRGGNFLIYLLWLQIHKNRIKLI